MIHEGRGLNSILGNRRTSVSSELEDSSVRPIPALHISAPSSSMVAIALVIALIAYLRVLVDLFQAILHRGQTTVDRGWWARLLLTLGRERRVRLL